MGGGAIGKRESHKRRGRREQTRQKRVEARGSEWTQKGDGWFDRGVVASLWLENMGKEAESPTKADCVKMSASCACSNLRRASRAVTQLFDSYFEEIGLKATQFTVLAALAWSDDAPPTIGELAETLVLEQSSLSRNLAVLERLGFIRLVPRPEDRRERIVTMLRTGRAALTRGYPAWRKAQGAIAAALEVEELDQQLRSLRRLTKTAQSLCPRERRRPRTSRATNPA
jgi:DNA-binding MarR family transcriptional regulator